MNFNEWYRNQERLRLVEMLMGLACGDVLLEAGEAIPAELTDGMFVPPRRFDERRRAKKFLAWLQDQGVPVGAYIEAMNRSVNEPQSNVEPPPVFGGGAVGRAYPVGNDHVVKFTTDEREAQFASKMVGSDLPYVAKMYDVVTIGQIVSTGGSVKTLYAILQERLHTGVAKKTRIAGNALYSYLDKFAQPLEDVEAAFQHIVSNYLTPKQRRDEVILRELKKLLDSTKDLQNHSGMTYRDPHGGNLLYKGRSPAFFDLGRSTPTPGAHLPTPKVL